MLTKRAIKLLSLTLCFIILFSAAAVSAQKDVPFDSKDNVEEISPDNEYLTYLAKYSSLNYADNEIVLTADMITNTENKKAVVTEDNRRAVFLGGNNGFAEYSFNVGESGLYNICTEYKPIKDTTSDIRFGFQFDGTTPYSDLNDIFLSRIWKNQYDKIKTDDNGDELRPEQTEKYEFHTQWAKNELGLYSNPYEVYLEKGTHTVRINSVAESAFISKIILTNYGKRIPDYNTYKTENSACQKAKSDYIIEAENAFEKSSSTLAPTIDNTNAGMSPISARKRLVNSFGKDSWTKNGQWASWYVPEDIKEGMYVLRFRAKQNGEVGTVSYRRLYINGEVPFKEAENIAFKYKDGWQIATLGEKEPYLIHLKPGDKLTLEATTGLMAEPLNNIYSSVTMLNDIYQSIIIVTGASPDPERDYNIQKEVPSLLDDIKKARDSVSNIGKSISNIMGQNNPKVFFINKFITVLNSYLANYRLIVPELGTLKSYIESYAGETYDFNTLPLELDTIMLMSPDSEEPKAEPGFFKSLGFELTRFMASFTSEYAKTANKEKGKTITVWSSLGRDQAQSVKNIINNYFTPKTGINVDFKISVTSLAEAILSGKEPDVSISVSQELPVNLAMRSQAVDLTNHINKLSDEYMSQFPESAWTPFKYEGGIYAMPVTQDFQMLFYRSDVLSKLGISVPKTWDEFYLALRELQRNNFQVGLRESDSTNPGVSVAINFYETLLLQNGEEYFKNNLKEVNFESNGGKKAFTDWVRLYRDFDLDTDFDITSRFRSGEMALVITSYSYYQTLSTIAPEITGRWAVAPLPATVGSDGNEHRQVSSILSGTVILKGAEKRKRVDEAFKFISWWADSEAQVEYSNAMEALQGIAGRPAVANKNAFNKIGWPEKEKALINEQREYVEAIPQVPGTYIINRSLTNALRKSYNESVDPLRQLSVWCRTINVELARKRAEFDENN